MNNDDFRRLVTGHHTFNDDDMAAADALLEAYPYLQALRAIRLKALLAAGKITDGSETNDAIYLPDRKRFYAWAMSDRPRQQQSTGQTNSRTIDLIDSFLNMASQHTAADYTDDADNDHQSARTGETQTRQTLPATDTIRHAHTDSSASTGGDYSLDEENIDEACFTETLAKIYTKQGRYEKAIEIIRKLSLKYPKKSTYFASQIKTLEELINNNKTETN